MGIVVVIILIIVGTFLFLKSGREDIPIEDSLINASKKCESMFYPGAGAIGHKSGLDCYEVYHAAFGSDKSYHCEYLSLDKNKAICFGSSVTSWENKSICNQFEGDNKEICILNVLNKLDSLNLLSTLEGSSLCSDFQNQDLYKICKNYQNVILKDYSSCLSEGNINNYCVYGFIAINKNTDLSKSLCEATFNKPVERFKCLFESSAIDSTWLNGSLNLGIMEEENIEKNVSFLFSEIYIETEYPILLRCVKDYWKENPNYIEGSAGLTSSEFILDTDMHDYICNKKIKSILDIEDSCIPYDWSELFDTSSFPNISWNYYKMY